MKKKLMALFAFVLIVVGVCFLNIEGSMVQAAESIGYYTDEIGGDFKSVQYSDISGFRSSTYSAPEPDGYEEYLFAGWYSEQECENALDSSIKEGEAWAKFVPAGVLSVKSQVQLIEDTGKYNMRFISTIDTLNYGEVGFRVQYHNGTGYSSKINKVVCKEVYTRIKATAESGVDYNYSPKVVDTKSEYFMTVTLLNIGSQNVNNIFRVVPYWKTIDGTMVYGVNRYITVNDGINNDDTTANNDVFSFNVKQDALDWAELAVTGVEASNVNYRHKDGDKYVSVIVSGQNESTMSSATKFEITGAEDDESINVVHRNYNTTHIKSGSTTANADSTWYTVYNGIDSTTDEYVIATSADLYGFSALTQNTTNNKQTFDNKTVYVVADITLNEGESATTWSSASGPTYQWTPIGNVQQKFQGVFDAQMHTISGIYVSEITNVQPGKTTTHPVGFFRYLRDNKSKVLNLNLINSYFYAGKGQVGSIAGYAYGEFNSIHSTAIVESGDANVGGIVGRVQYADSSDAACEMTNCWFDGSVTSVSDSTSYTGGLVGAVIQNAMNITDCLNTGEVIANITTAPGTSDVYTYTAGICGGVMNKNKTVTITDCFNNADIHTYYYSLNSETGMYEQEENTLLLAAGVINAANGTFTINRAYDISNQKSVGRQLPTSAGNSPTWRGYWQGSENDIKGTVAYLKEATNSSGTTSYGTLDYYTSSKPDGKWIVREDDMPALKSFVTDGIDVGWYFDNIDDDTYTISTEEELYGLAALSATKTFSTTIDGETKTTTIEGQDFEGKTINLMDDIKLNSGKSSEWVDGTRDAARAWPMIGRNSTTPFRGTFDGNGHTIKGVYMNVSTSATDAGLFGYTLDDATIKNIKLSNSAFVTPSNNSGALGCIAGKGEGTFVNLYCDDSVIIDTKGSIAVGGIIGNITKAAATAKCTIVNCWFDGNISQEVTSSSHVNSGGIVGLQVHGNNTNDKRLTIEDCLYTGEMNVTATFTGSNVSTRMIRAGGIIGGKNDSGNAVLSMSNCLSDGQINATNKSVSTNVLAGGLLGAVGYGTDGQREKYGVTYSNVYATTDCYTNALGVYPTDMSALNHEDMTITFDTSANLYNEEADLEYVYHWESSASETPRLRYYQGTVPVNHEWYVESVGDAADPYLIRTADELDAVATMTNSATTDAGTTFVGETLKLANDIVYNEGTEAYDTVEKWKVATELKQWTPIGTATEASDHENRFQGTFDGANHSVIGLYVTDEDSTAKARLGLFGAIKDATIQNVGVVDSYFQSSANDIIEVGSIAGCGDGIFNNVYSNATINVSGARVGGLLGTVQEAKSMDDTYVKITDGWFEGTIVNEYSAQMITGGLVGFVFYGTTILENCIYSGEIDCTSTATSAMNLNVGGMVGSSNSSSAVAEFKITDSLCTGTVSTTSTNSIAMNRVGYVVGNPNAMLNADGVYAPIEKCTKAIGYSSLKSGSVVTIAEQSTWNAGAASLGFDLTDKWVTRQGNIPGLRAFVSDSYDTEGYVIADTSWFVGEDAPEGTVDDPYIISDANDFYGLPLLVSAGETFNGKTIKVADDLNEIDLNAGWTAGSGCPDIIWNPIGCNGNYFKGTFNGNGVTIKGVYANSNNLDYIGLFGFVHANATIENFKLLNSHFVQNTGAESYVGSIAADMRGSASAIYSNALIDSSCQYTGGLFALVNGGDTTLSTDEATGITTHDRGIVPIQDAWYDGEINITYKGASNIYRYAGGIVSVVVQGTVDMDNILFTGTLNAVRANARAYAGGIVGATLPQTIESETKQYQDDDYTTIELTNCISAGVVNQDGSQRGSIVGRLESKINSFQTDGVVTKAYLGHTYLKIQNVFATSECYDYAYHDNSVSVDVTNLETNEVTKVTANGLITDATGTTGAAIVQSQYNSDQLIGYCTEYDYGDTTYNLSANLNFSETGWTMRTDGVPIPTVFSSLVDSNTLVSDPSTLTSTLGLDYWGAEKTLANAVNSGKGNYLLNYTVSNENTYEGFIAYLADKGFTEAYVSNTDSSMALDGVYNSTYVNGNWVLNITYVENKGTIDVVINTYGADSLSPNLSGVPEEQAGGDDDVQLSMLSLSDSGVMGEYGNSFVLRLPNGHFIVSDGGKTTDAMGLMDYLKVLAGTSINEEGQEIQNPVYIDAWVLTHFHTDHCGALMQLYENTYKIDDKTSIDLTEYRKDVYIKALYVNEPNNYAKLFEDNVYENASKTLAGAMMFTQAPDNDAKPYVYRMHTGERYYFNGVTMDVVLTQEQLDPHYDAGFDTSKEAYRYYGDWDGFNATSTTCVFTVTDTQDKIYMGGDSNKANMNYIMQAYSGATDCLVHVKEEGSSSNPYLRYTEQVRDANNSVVSDLTAMTTSDNSQTLSGITVFVALHHGKNTSRGFTQYLFGGEEEKLEYVLFPYHQMYEAVFSSEAREGNDGKMYENRYWMQDNSTVFDYDIKNVNQTLYGYADGKYYTYGYADCTGVTANNPHGTVELIFGSSGITTNVLE